MLNIAGGQRSQVISKDGVFYAWNGTDWVVIPFAANYGVAGSGVVASEFGDGYNHSTILTVAKVDALTFADNSALCMGHLLYTFPAGEIIVESASISMAILAGSSDLQADTPEVGLGTVLGSDTQATLGADDAACEDILGPATADDCNGTAEVLTVAVKLGVPLVLAAADAHLVHFNAAATWSDDTEADLTGDIEGTVTLNWKFIA